MELAQSTLRILDLSEKDRAELAQELPPDTVTHETPTGTDQGGMRDFITTATIVVVSEVTLRLLALWITRHTTREETEVSIQTETPTGAKKTIHIRAKSASSQSEAAVLKQLAAVCKVDIKDLETGEDDSK